MRVGTVPATSIADRPLAFLRNLGLALRRLSTPWSYLLLFGGGLLAWLWWLAWRVRLRRPTLGRFIGFYSAAFFAFGYLARFFAHNYVAALIALACRIVPLAGLPFQTGESVPAEPGETPGEGLSAA